ncbi:MAG: alanine racemase [Acidobacteriota bacterium]
MSDSPPTPEKPISGTPAPQELAPRKPSEASSLWPLHAEELAELIAARRLVGNPGARGERVITDSRAGIRPGDLFFGLVGPRFDGGLYAADALAGGASVAVVGPPSAARLGGRPLDNDQAWLAVDDPLAALQRLAAEARRRYRGQLLAITGSNGKTTVKDMLVAILGGGRRVFASPQSYNSQVGVALSLLELDPQSELAVLECGISEPGEMERLETMVRPDLGLFVNVGDAHLEGLGSQGVTAWEKAQLFRRLPADAWVWLPAAQSLARRALANLPHPPNQRLLVQPFDPEPGPLLAASQAGKPVGNTAFDAGAQSQEPAPGLNTEPSPDLQANSETAGDTNPPTPDAQTADSQAPGTQATQSQTPPPQPTSTVHTLPTAASSPIPSASLLPGDPPKLIYRQGDGSLLPPAPLPLHTASPQLLEDAALAAAAALDLGATAEEVEAGLAAWQPAPMRLEITTTPRGVLLINDAYTADPASVEGALWALARETSPGAARAVLAGMDQLGPAREAAHRRVGQRVQELGIHTLLGVGPGGAEMVAAAREAGLDADSAVAVANVREAALWLEERCRPGDRVLLKGSRSARLERVADLLLDAGAPARLTVDLDQLAENFHHLRAFVQPAPATTASGATAQPSVALMAVVKSFGYGLDAVRLSHTLQREGCDAFAVAYVDEGVQLRRRGITAPILVQNPIRGEAEKLVRHGLSAEVADPAQIPWLAAEGQRQRRAVRAHLKIDTGMGRAGVMPQDALETARTLRAENWLLLDGVMTHFAAADDPQHDDFTRQQIHRFDHALAALRGAGLHPRWVHAANSAALARFPEARYTLVRTGLALLGYSQAANQALGNASQATSEGPSGGTSEGASSLHPVLRLTTEIISVKELPPDHAAGYGLTWRTPDHPRRIALVALGYNDGYPWTLSNRGAMAVGGVLCPVVGRISMDVTLLDVTALPTPAQAGDQVVAFGPGDEGSREPDLLELARQAGTIPYELLTRIGPRVRRVFQTRY